MAYNDDETVRTMIAANKMRRNARLISYLTRRINQRYDLTARELHLLPEDISHILEALQHVS